MSLCHDTLGNYYELNAALIKYHQFTLSELENMFPFERQIYTILVKKFIDDENKEIEKQQKANKT